jgi:hypothetical protein
MIVPWMKWQHNNMIRIRYSTAEPTELTYDHSDVTFASQVALRVNVLCLDLW